MLKRRVVDASWRRNVPRGDFHRGKHIDRMRDKNRTEQVSSFQDSASFAPKVAKYGEDQASYALPMVSMKAPGSPS